MIARILPESEWERLAGIDVALLLPYAQPGTIDVVVVEDGERIVGTWAVMRMVHLEGVWIDPAYRGAGAVARRLLKTTFETARQYQSDWAMTGAATKEIASLLVGHLGAVYVPMETYVVPLKES